MKLQWNYYFLKEYILVWWLTVANYALSFPPTSSFYARNGSTVNTPLPTLELNHEGLWWVLGDEFQRLSQKFVFFSFLPYVGMGKHLYNLYVHSTLLGVQTLHYFNVWLWWARKKKRLGSLSCFLIFSHPHSAWFRWCIDNLALWEAEDSHGLFWRLSRAVRQKAAERVTRKVTSHCDRQFWSFNARFSLVAWHISKRQLREGSLSLWPRLSQVGPYCKADSKVFEMLKTMLYRLRRVMTHLRSVRNHALLF